MRRFKAKLILLDIVIVSFICFGVYGFLRAQVARSPPIETASDPPLFNRSDPGQMTADPSVSFFAGLDPEDQDMNPPLGPSTSFSWDFSGISIIEPIAVPVQPTHHHSSYFDKLEGISFWGSLLYWRPRQSFMDIALRSKHCCHYLCPNTAGGASWKHAKRIEIEPDYELGYKIGFELAPINWGLFADYTSFEFDKTHSVSSFEKGFLFGRWIQPGVVINNSATHIKANWWMRMNVLNFEAERKCYFGRRLMLKPHFGIATAWIDQRLKARFLLNMPENELKMRHESDSWGIGPRVGGDLDLRLFRGFGIVGTAAADLLYTHYDLDLKARSPNNRTLFSGISSDLDVLRAELELYLGINTHFRVARRTFLNLELGYDFQIWWNQNMMRWNNDAGWTSSPEGNLYLEGLRFTLKLDF
jgi:hypothetical protein